MSSNTLFNQPLMKKYLKKYKKEFKFTHKRKEALLNWIKKLENGELKDEVSNYGSFSRTILENILGYNYDKNIEENVKEEYGRGFSEFALKKDNKKFMVIELKGSDSNLDKPQNRANDKRTPVDQAFDYAKRSGDIDWIMVSNYSEFRLYNYHKRTHKYISFQVKELLDQETFEEFMLIFSRFSTIDENLIEKLVSKTIFVERDLESEFYKLYNETRLMIIKELESIHSEFTREQSVHYAQLILNRYIFICFAEDLGLLPGEISVESIENPVKNNNLGRTEIWHRLNSLFIDINEGNEFKKIYAYNGGLFNEDLEFLKIRDIVEDHSIFSDAYQKWKFEEYSLLVEEKLSPYSGQINPIYKNLMTISTFNFSSEVDVNILGHIFENSIGDIEELKADTKGRRKKDGIFYTPEHITEYICQNTIIPYLSKSGHANTIQKLISEYSGSEIEELDNKVGKIKIIDPACGSGAFLNKAGDILLEIHKAIHKKKYMDKMDTLAPYFDNIGMRREILLNNIYGVDLNEESVEITKLSLFLKVCKKGLKLPNLDNNIKCGNSLIDDSKYTNKSFKWEEEFKTIFDNGGFDVVVGNPPYVRQERIKEIKPYLKDNYEVYTGVADLFVYFFERGLNVLKEGGMLAFICSDRFTMTKYGENLRKLILKNEFKEYIYHSENIFESAAVLSCTVVIKKGTPRTESNILFNYEFEIPQSKFDSGFWSFETPEILNLRDKIENSSLKLREIPNLNIYSGIKTGYNKALIIDQETKNEIIKKDPKSESILKPLLRGNNISKWKINYENIYLILTKNGVNIAEYPAISEHLSLYEDQLKKRSDQGNFWYNLRDCAYYSEFENKKIIWTEMTPKPAFLVDTENYFLLNTSYMLISNESEFDLSYLVSLLNSNLIFWIFKKISPKLYAQRLRFIRQYVEQLPIYPATPEEQEPFIKKADQMMELNKTLQNEINSFKEWLTHIFKVEKFSKKLEKYYELSLDDFLAELKKKKVDVKNRENFTTLKEEFEKSVSKIRPLLNEIEETDNEIDQMVYELYGLSDDEIKIVEDSLN